MECSNCTTVSPLFDQGTVELRRGSSQITSYPYRNKEQLLHFMHQLQIGQTGINDESDQPMIRISGVSEPYRSEPAFIPLQQYAARLQHHRIVDIIRQRKFTSYMQPILHADNESIFGYEFLLRPHPSGPDFKPFELFEVARETGLHSFLDRQARLCAIETSAAHLKRGTKRFINFLPSSIYNPNYCLSHTFQAIEDLQLDPSDLVFEVVETEKVEDTDHLKKVFKVYKEHGVNVALDDVGQGFSTLALVADLQPDYIKIDRATIDGCDRDKDKQATIGGIITLAADFGGVVLAEGIERAEEWAFVKSAGVQLGQGYLFGKPAAHAVGC